jgi:hypothetical protein
VPLWHLIAENDADDWFCARKKTPIVGDDRHVVLRIQLNNQRLQKRLLFKI